MGLSPKSRLAAVDELTFRVAGLSSRRRQGGFTFVEILLAVSVGAAVLAAAVICFQTIGASSSRIGTYGAVTVGQPALSNFYGSTMTGTSVRTWFAPNFGRLENVESIKAKFQEDVQRAVAVFALPRSGRSSIRPTSITLSGSYDVTTFDVRRISTSEDFRTLLASAIPASSTTFTANPFASNGSARGLNLSIFILIRSNNAPNLTVHSIYEVDFVNATAAPFGVYASVRRYQGTTMTDYYDVFYPDALGATSFYTVASFERFQRPNTTSALTTSGKSQPSFYLIWWPDPAMPNLPTAGFDYLTSMKDQTSLMMVVPMFPAL